MPEVTQKKQPTPTQINMRPRPEDLEILEALQKKLGVDNAQIFRMGIRLLAEKEGLRA